MVAHRSAVDAQVHLTPTAEAEWIRFRRHLELADGFWLAFLFSSSTAGVHVFEERTERVLRAHASSQAVLAPRTPEELADIVARVLTLCDLDTLACLWVEAVFADRSSEQNGRWSDAWMRALLALNQARQRLREMPGGLVIAAPTWLKPSLPAAAPDLWSIRTLVIDLATVPAMRLNDESGPTRELGISERSIASAARLTLEPLQQGGEGSPQLRQLIEQLRRVERLAVAGDAAEALELGHEAVSHARAIGEPLPLAQALVVVANVEGASGDPAAAAHHLGEALPLLRSSPAGEPLLRGALGPTAELAAADGDLAFAAELFDERIGLAREQLEDLGETEQALRDLSVSLNKLGDTQLAAGDIANATNNYQESLDLARRILDTHGPTPQALRDLSISLNKLGNTQLAAGDIANATNNYQESLNLDRRILDTHGPTPQTLRDLSVGLERLGDTQLAAGDIANATNNYQESLDLRRRILDAYGPTPQALRDLSISLNKLGDTQLAAGDIANATNNYQESLNLDRRILDTYGPTPQALRDLSISLNKLAGALEATGETKRANELRDEARSLAA